MQADAVGNWPFEENSSGGAGGFERRPIIGARWRPKINTFISFASAAVKYCSGFEAAALFK